MTACALCQRGEHCNVQVHWLRDDERVEPDTANPAQVTCRRCRRDYLGWLFNNTTLLQRAQTLQDAVDGWQALDIAAGRRSAETCVCVASRPAEHGGRGHTPAGECWCRCPDFQPCTCECWGKAVTA